VSPEKQLPTRPQPSASLRIVSASPYKLAASPLSLLTALLLLGCSGGSTHGDKRAEKAARGEASHPIPMFPALGQEGAGDRTVIIRVGPATITRADFARLDKVLTPRLASYEPKSRADCSSFYAPREVKLPKGGSRLSPAKVKALCVAQHQKLVKEQTLRELISYQWVTGEARELGLDPSQAEVRQALAKTVAQQFKHKREFQRHLEDTGETMPELLSAVRRELDNQRIHELIERKSEGRPKPGHAAIVRYYRAHKSSLQGKPLKQVESTVRERVSEELLNHVQAAFVRQFREKWIARTSCSPGYVISHCREWKGQSLVVGGDPYAVG
jgi:hypothetical protein